MAIADIYRGNTKTFKFNFVDSSNTPIDITGWSIWFTAKAIASDTDVDAVIQVSTTAGDDALDVPASGLMYLTVTSTDSDVTPQALHYDFKRVIPGSPANIKTLDKGTFKILDIITISS